VLITVSTATDTSIIAAADNPAADDPATGKFAATGMDHDLVPIHNFFPTV